MDAYDRTARLAPAYIALFPISVLVVALFGGEDWWDRIVALLIAAGLPILLADMVRHIGKSKQIELWERWGGSPTTQLLRHHPATGNAVRNNNHTLRGVRRAHVERITGLALPTAGDERKRKKKADEVYDAAIALVRPRANERSLVARENRLYGFWRNLYGGRGFVALMGLLGVMSSVALYLFDHFDTYSVALGWVVLDGIVGIAWMILAWRVITEEAVKRAANNYATEVMQVLPILPPNEPITSDEPAEDEAKGRLSALFSLVRAR